MGIKTSYHSKWTYWPYILDHRECGNSVCSSDLNSRKSYWHSINTYLCYICIFQAISNYTFMNVKGVANTMTFTNLLRVNLLSFTLQYAVVLLSMGHIPVPWLYSIGNFEKKCNQLKQMLLEIMNYITNPNQIAIKNVLQMRRFGWHAFSMGILQLQFQFVPLKLEYNIPSGNPLVYQNALSW